jgi:integrase/recombinase XerD
VGARGSGRPITIPGDPADISGWPFLVEEFCVWMGSHGYSPRTIHNRRHQLSALVVWLAERGVTRPVEVTRPMLERYQRWLFHYRKANGEPLSFRSQSQRLLPVRAFFKWAARSNVVLYNPASEIELPKVEHRLPKPPLTAAEAEQVLAMPDLTTPSGVRDRAMLEVLYSTGIRRSELAHLAVFDIDAARQTLLVRQGKGRKDRMVPIGERALLWVARYLDQVRPLLVAGADDGSLFLTADGTGFSPDRLTQIARGYVKASGVTKEGACHLFRHTMATLMLEGGADIRYIQAMLGHAELSTTQIYTQVSIRTLQAVHAATHPGATNARHRSVTHPSLRFPDDIDRDGDFEGLLTVLRPKNQKRTARRLDRWAARRPATRPPSTIPILWRKTTMTTKQPTSTTVTEPRIRTELRIPIDAREAPIAFEDSYPDPTDLAVEMAGPAGLLATLVLPIDQAREWAAELFAAVSVAYREVTGDPHALTDHELAALPPADAYHPGPGLIVHGDEHEPARARFHIDVEIQAEFLSTAGLRAALVEAIAERFNTTKVAISSGEPTAGSLLHLPEFE